MPHPINPAPVPVATHLQIKAFQVNPEDLIGTINYAEGYQDDAGAFVQLRELEHHIDQAQLGALMNQPGDPERTLYEQIKDLLYGVLVPVPAAEPDPEAPEPEPESEPIPEE